jgi:hypothetical protein
MESSQPTSSNKKMMTRDEDPKLLTDAVSRTNRTYGYKYVLLFIPSIKLVLKVMEKLRVGTTGKPYFGESPPQELMGHVLALHFECHASERAKTAQVIERHVRSILLDPDSLTVLHGIPEDPGMFGEWRSAQISTTKCTEVVRKACFDMCGSDAHTVFLFFNRGGPRTCCLRRAVDNLRLKDVAIRELSLWKPSEFVKLGVPDETYLVEPHQPQEAHHKPNESRCKHVGKQPYPAAILDVRVLVEPNTIGVVEK